MATYYKQQSDGKLWPLPAREDVPAENFWTHILLTQEEYFKITEAADENERKAEHYYALNENLLRISKERANADRGLKPKKEHSGYVVISTGQKEYMYKDKGSTQKADLWETVLQTPFSVDFEAGVVLNEVKDQLLSRNSDLLEDIGFDYYYLAGYENLIKHDLSESIEEEEERLAYLNSNTIVKTRFWANFRTKYWNVELLHTRPLGVVPAYMLPVKQ